MARRALTLHWGAVSGQMRPRQAEHSAAHPGLVLETHLSQLRVVGSVTGAVFSMDETQRSNLK